MWKLIVWYGWMKHELMQGVRTHIWTDESVERTTNVQIGKGTRLILVHIGIAGFIRDVNIFVLHEKILKMDTM